MALAYTPPGVSVEEIVDTTVSPLLSVPASIALVGVGAGTITRTDTVTLTGTAAVALPGVSPSDTVVAAVIVMDAVTPALAPTGYDSSTDFNFSAGGKTIARRGGGIIPDGNTVYVTYTYTPADYFNAIRLDNMSDIAARFGSGYNPAGTAINSPLTYAASVAFENGAQDIVIQPLFHVSGGIRTAPNATQAADSAVWAESFVALRDIEDINVIVPVVGQSQANVGDAQQLAIISAAQDHMKFMKDNDQLLMTIAGEDSSASAGVAAPATLQSHATTLAARYGSDLAEQTVFIAPSKFTRALPTGTGTQLNVGGQYMAAAIAGMLAARPISQPLTRKFVAGFTSVAVARTKSERNADAASGICVIEQKGNSIQVRHGITTNTTSTIKREISIVRAKHRVMESCRATIDSQIIGNVIADGDAPAVVRSAIIGVLDGLQGEGDIVDYGDVQTRTASIDPTIIEVRFSYRPAIPVNYVDIKFSLDLTTQDVVFDDTTQVDTATV